MNRSEAIAYVISETDEADLTVLTEAIRSRRQALQMVKAAKLSQGSEVSLAGISPKYLDGMKGVIEAIRGNRADVRLDKQSTDILRFRGRGRFYVPEGTEAYMLRGAPLSTCQVEEKGRQL